MCESGDWFLLHDNATIVKQFLAQRKAHVLDHPPYSPDLAPADYFLFPKVNSHLKGRLFDSISGIQTAVTSTLNTIAKDGFYTKASRSCVTVQICVYSYKGSISKTKQNWNFFHTNTFYNASHKT